jgi:hypothetical protein
MCISIRIAIVAFGVKAMHYYACTKTTNMDRTWTIYYTQDYVQTLGKMKKRNLKTAVSIMNFLPSYQNPILALTEITS